jgi:formiminotetrahydrofolate cyclodeaminase
MLYAKKSVHVFLKELASEAPVPGGGAASALCASLAFSLGLMVARLGLKRKSLKKKQPAIQSCIRRLENLQNISLHVFEKDPQIYQEVARTWKTKTQDQSLLKAFQIQKKLKEACLKAVCEIRFLKQWIKGPLAKDLDVSLVLLAAATRGAHLMAQVNIDCFENRALKKRVKL